MPSGKRSVKGPYLRLKVEISTKCKTNVLIIREQYYSVDADVNTQKSAEKT